MGVKESAVGCGSSAVLTFFAVQQDAKRFSRSLPLQGNVSWHGWAVGRKRAHESDKRGRGAVARQRVLPRSLWMKKEHKVAI